MNRKLTAIIVLGLLLCSSIPILMTDSSDADDSKVAVYKPSVYVNRNDYTETFYEWNRSYWEGRTDRFYADSTVIGAKDTEMEKYMNGEISSYVNSELIEGHSYYFYYSTRNNPSGNGATKIFKSNSDISLIPLNPGKSTITVDKIEGAGKVRFYYGFGDTSMRNYRYVASDISPGDTFNVSVASFTTGYFSSEDSSISVKVYYRITPEPAVGECEPTKKIELSLKDSTWEKGTLHLNAGTYYFYGSSDCFLIKSGNDTQFVNDIVSKDKFYRYKDGDEITYNIIDHMRTQVTIPSGEYILYYLGDRETVYYDYEINTTTSSTHGEKQVHMSVVSKQEEKTYRIYAEGNSTFKFGAVYDSDKYQLFLVTRSLLMNNYTPLESGVLYSIDNTDGQNYYLMVTSDSLETGDPFTVYLDIQTGGIPESDENSTTFALVAIAICVVVFGLLLIAGRRPKW